MENGLAVEDIVFTGCVDEKTLEECYRTAVALLMPLWDDERSISRYPNKLPEYLASGRPVVAGNVGDLTEVLIDGTSAYLAKPGDDRAFAEKMIAILHHPQQATQIGAAGRRACKAHLDYRAHVEGLGAFFGTCFDRQEQPQRVPINKSERPGVGRAIRNAICGLLAVTLIIGGRVRKARRTAFAQDAVSAIYFHKPNQRLFALCINWLTSHGYVFVSADDVFAFIQHGKALPRGAVWLSFDDGWRETLTDVLPLIRRRNIPVTLFIPSGIIDGDGLFPWMQWAADPRSNTNATSTRAAVRDSITLTELRTIATYPQVTIAAHTVNHAVTTGLSEEQTWFELAECKRSLESWTGRPVRYFAYPTGKSDGREEEALQELGYYFAATTESALVTRSANPYQTPRFSVADEIFFPEAICNMVGVWRPFLDPIIAFVQRCRSLASGRPVPKRHQRDGVLIGEPVRSRVSSDARF